MAIPLVSCAGETLTEVYVFHIATRPSWATYFQLIIGFPLRRIFRAGELVGFRLKRWHGSSFSSVTVCVDRSSNGSACISAYFASVQLLLWLFSRCCPL